MSTALPVRRLPGWPERLAAHFESHRHTRFEWGASDCVLFAAGAAHAVTGQHLLPVTWRSREGAVQLLRQYGGLAAAVDSVLPRLPSTVLAQRGDLLLLHWQLAPGRRRLGLAVSDGTRAWGISAAGLTCADSAHACIAWGVGHG